MSNSTSNAPFSASDLSELAQEVYLGEVTIATQIAPLVLLVYDSLLTFSEEVTYVWSKKIRLGSILYFCAKYGLIVNYCFIIALNIDGGSNDNICTPLLALSNIGDGASAIGYSGLAALRGYAIANNKPVWKAILISLFLMNTAGTLLAFCFSVPCGGAAPWSVKAVIDVTIIQVVLTPLTEGVTLSLLLVHARTKFRDLKRDLEQPQRSFMDICRQQSINIFSTVLILGIEQAVATPTIVEENVSSPALTIVTDLIGPIPIILLCRFFLELRKAHSTPNGSLEGDNQLPWSTFKAAVHNVDTSIVDEFGDHSSEGRTSATQGDVDSILNRTQYRSRSPSITAIEEQTYEMEETAVSRVYRV